MPPGCESTPTLSISPLFLFDDQGIAMARKPEEFNWREAANPKMLSLWESAPESPGFYELGYVKNGVFSPMYGGRASELSLRQRLRQHWLKSHNLNVRRNRSKLWYRCKGLPTAVHARLVEAHYIAAYEYPWNQRQEWTEFWQDI